MIYVKDNINPTTLSTNIQYYGQDRLPVVQMFCCCRSSFCTKHIPSMLQVDGVGITSARDTFPSSSLVNAALFVFRRDSSAFASAHGSGHSGHQSCSHFCSSATRIIWLKRFQRAFRTTCWPFIWYDFALIVENVFSLCFVILSWNFTDGGSSSNLVSLND